MRTNVINYTLKISTILLILGAAISCNDSNYKESIAMDVSSEAETTQINKEQSNKPIISTEGIVQTPPQLLIIKTATTRYKVDNVKMASAKIKSIAQQYGAYISDLQFENTLYEKQNKFTLKVPNANFDSLLDSLSSNASFIDYERITTQDVTEEYLDIETRLATKIEVKARYETILRKNANTVKDILLTEEKLRQLQEEIESAQGRLKYLSTRVSFSTIHVDLYETVVYKEQPESYTKTFANKAVSGFKSGWDMIASIAIGLIYIWPLIILGLIIFIVIKRIVKK